MENECLAKCHGIFVSAHRISFEKNVLITYNFDTQ